jgi:uncharacterized membrane protein (DUF2068 family)
LKAARNLYLLSIAIFRLVKAVLLIAAGFGALRLLHPAVAQRFERWIASLPFAGRHDVIRHTLAMITHLSPQRAELIAAAAWAYAALFSVEGTGLLLQKTWAEWLTLVATVSFIPFEVVEVMRRSTPLRWSIVIINVVIALYLLARRLKMRRPAISGLAGPFSIR